MTSKQKLSRRGVYTTVADWRKSAEINGDVVFFRYAPEGISKGAEEVFIWDLDKTYLDTTIDSLQGLIKTIMEKALNKKNVPGTDTLLRNLAQYRSETKGTDFFPIYFITASPPQLEDRIAEKFYIDNINPLGCFYKDNLKNLRPKRFWRLTKQVGYKLQALMQLRTMLGESVKQICWGDDSESDAIIYNLYSDICSRRLSPNDIRVILEQLYVTGDQVDVILNLQAQVPTQDPLEKIYINLATDTDPEYYLKFGRRTLPTYNTFQVTMDLYQDKKINFDGVVEVAQDMIYNYYYTVEELMKSFDDLIRRSVLSEETYKDLKQKFIEKGLLHASYEPSHNNFDKKLFIEEPWVQEHVDYVNEYR